MLELESMGSENYLAIDVGASKTLFAVFDSAGQIICECKIPTDPDYKQFLADIAQNLKSSMSQFKFSYCCCAVPGKLDLQNGVALAFGNEDWRNVPIKKDLEDLLPGVKVLIHNDAKLAALSETKLLQKKYEKVLYLTISTGIGGGVITNDTIAADYDDFEPGQMIFEYQGQNRQWEDFASGRAFKEKYGKRAADVDDPAVWQEYSKTLAAGFENLLATVQPDAVIIGGGVGAHFEKFQHFLEQELKNINNPLVPIPPLLKAQHAEEAVIYGCYDYIRQNIE